MGKHSASKVLLIIVGAVFALILLSGLAGGMYMVRFALQPEDRSVSEDSVWVSVERSYPGLHAWYDSLAADGIFRDTLIERDGVSLSSFYAEAERNTGKTAVIVHGYTSSPFGMLMIARMFRDSLGYNVWLPALYGHGRSGGDVIRMGWKDRLDVLAWSEIAHERFRDTMQVIHGISMGGATTMMLSGEQTPDYIRCFIEDCGYTDVWDQFKYKLKEEFGLPAFPVLYGADIVCRMEYGWGFREASSVKQLRKCTKPMLFIHGALDDYVPTEMLYVNYEAKESGYKEMWLVPDTKHAESYRNYPAEYTACVRSFLSR